MPTQVQHEEALIKLLTARWEQVSQKIEQLAAEFPEHRFDWRPRPGIRTCAEVLRHVAFWNRYVADSLRGNQPDGEVNELPAGGYPAKPQILNALHESAQGAAAALRDRFDAELVLPFIEHTSEHYGQLVAYARLLPGNEAIVPPASRS